MSPNIRLRIIFITSLAVVFLFYSAYIVSVNSRNIDVEPNKLLLSIFFTYGIFLLLRIAFTAADLERITDLMNGSLIQAISFLAGILSSIGIFVGLIILNLQRVERDFLSSVKEVKILKGIIPICLYCKGIRDDRGAWNKLEEYISEHSDAQFSHGICEKCLREHYPEEAY